MKKTIIIFGVLFTFIALIVWVRQESMKKFNELNQSLEQFVQESSVRSHSTISKIDSLTQEGQFPKSTKKNIHLLSDTTTYIIEYIEVIKNQVLENATQKDSILIGSDAHLGLAYPLQIKLNNHINWINTTFNKSLPLLALDGKDDPYFVNQETGEEIYKGAKNKDFAHLNFEGTPMIASLAFLTEKQAKLQMIERDILEEVKAQVKH